MKLHIFHFAFLLQLNGLMKIEAEKYLLNSTRYQESGQHYLMIFVSSFKCKNSFDLSITM